MANRFEGTLEQLQKLIENAHIKGKWSEDPSGKHTFRTQDGGVLNWWPSKSTVLIQGAHSARPQLYRLFQNNAPANESTIYATLPTVAEIPLKDSIVVNQISHTTSKIDCGQVLGHKYRDSDLVIALVGAVGTKLKNVEEILRDRLAVFGYNSHEIRISRDVISKIVPVTAVGTDEYSRISKMMDCGDEARENADDNAILALGVAAHISELRNNIPLPTNKKFAVIINSLKRPEEVRRLREIYPRAFYLVGVHSDESRRKQYLVEDRRMEPEHADTLIKRDEDEQGDYGQRLSDTFHMSDFFVRVDGSDDRLKNSLWRVLDILFGHPYKTPTFDEYAMFLAFSASLRSADLSRQVGSVLARDRELLATGANDCPKSKGGLYWPDLNEETDQIEDEEGGRDHMRGIDSNKEEQRKMIEEIVVDSGNSLLDLDALRGILEESRIRDLTEFGRVVHAEMEALLACARNGLSTKGATLYCTTFPCHNCAKHIIAAGVERVVFVEPYQKSKAADFHNDAIKIGFDNPKTPEDVSDVRVRFEPFVGVGPRRFFDLFSMKLGSGSELKRKSANGKTISWKPETAILRVQMLPHSYLELEKEAAGTFLHACNQN